MVGAVAVAGAGGEAGKGAEEWTRLSGRDGARRGRALGALPPEVELC